MSEEQVANQLTTEQEQDPLAQAAGGVDTSYPLLPADKRVILECASCTVAPVKDHPERSTMTLVLKTTEETAFQDGKKCRPGFKLYQYIGITPTPPTDKSDGRTIENIRRDLAFVLKAFYGPIKANEIVIRDFVNNPSMIDGKKVQGITTISKGTGSFPDKNGVKFVIPAN